MKLDRILIWISLFSLIFSVIFCVILDEERREEPALPQISIDDPRGQQEEPTNPQKEEHKTGLSLYFENKLSVKPDKVSKYLNIRLEPSEESTILSIIFPNELVEVIEKEGDWYRINQSGIIGYVHGDYVLVGEECWEYYRNSISYFAMAKQTPVYLYTDAEDDQSGIVTLKKGESVVITGYTGENFIVSKETGDAGQKLYLRVSQAAVYFAISSEESDSPLPEDVSKCLQELANEDSLAEVNAIEKEAEEERAESERILKENEENRRIAEETARRQAEANARSNAASVPAEPPHNPVEITDGKVPQYSILGTVCPYEYCEFIYNTCVEMGIEWFYPYFICQIYQESKFNQNARNFHADGTVDVGICQLKDKYAWHYCLATGHPEFDIYENPYHNMYIGLYLMKRNLDTYGNQLIPALNDYFAGAGTSMQGIWYEYANHVLSWFPQMVRVN